MTISTPARAVALLVIAGLTMTACGGATETASAPTTAAAPAADGGTYADINALQDAYILAGGECEDGKYWGYVSYADATMECDFDTMIDVFPDAAAVASYQARDREQGYGATMLQGLNWTIRDAKDQLPKLKEKMGGTIVTYTAKG